MHHTLLQQLLNAAKQALEHLEAQDLASDATVIETLSDAIQAIDRTIDYSYNPPIDRTYYPPFSSLEEARNAAQVYYLETLEDYLKTYDHLARSGAIEKPEILQGLGFAKCVFRTTGEDIFLPAPWKNTFASLRQM